MRKEAKEYLSKINKLIGVKEPGCKTDWCPDISQAAMLRSRQESDTGLAPPSQWDLEGDKQMMKQDGPRE